MREIIFLIIGLVVGGAIMYFIGHRLGEEHRKKVAEAAVGSAEEQAKKIVSDAYKAAEAKKKETILEARTRSTAFAVNRIKRFANAEMKFSVRNAEFSKKKNLLTEK